MRQKRSSLWRVAAAAMLVSVTLGVIGAPAPALAVHHNVPGVACAAFNNNQANYLERSHVRIYNPPTSPASLWVICPVQRRKDDIDTAGTPWGYIDIYWSNLSTATSLTCIVREYDYLTEAFPGVNDPINQVSLTVNRPSTPPAVTNTYFSFTNDDVTFLNFYTVACQLPRGTGINSIDFVMQ